VSCAVYALPLSVSHSMACGVWVTDPKRRSTASTVQIAHLLARDPRGGRRPGNHFPIAGIEHEDHTDGLAIPARHFKHIRTPPEIRAERADHAVVRALSPGTRVATQQQAVLLHEPVHALMIHGRLAERAIWRFNSAPTRR
jgi:hypothetical protein